MSKNFRFLRSFRARLMLLLTSFLLLTIVLVLVLDNLASKRVVSVIEEQNHKITEAVNGGYGDLAQAISLAMQSLNSENYLYEVITPDQLPRTIEHIVVTEGGGKVRDSTSQDLVDKAIIVPKEEVSQILPEDPVEGESHGHEHAPKTYFHPVRTTNGLFWIVIVTAQQTIITQIEEASETPTVRTQELSNYRLLATTELLSLALAIVVVIGWRFTRPINELAAAARRVAVGDLDFSVAINRRDEVGQLAVTFNEMISGLKSKIELEERLNQSERAADTGRLTQAVAHEIRNPLNVINLSVDQVRAKFAPEDEKRRDQFTRLLSSVKDEIVRLRHMVNDILNYGRPAQASVDRVDIQDLTRETIELVRPPAGEQEVEITFEPESATPYVIGDAERLKSCLSNLAINALQAVPSGGQLIARVHRVDGQVEVVISDTGVGIAQESLAKIFEPYFST